MVDPAIPQPNPTPVPEPVKVKISKRTVYVLAGIAGIILLAALFYIFLPQNIKQQLGIAGSNPVGTSDTQNTSEKPKNAIAKVGNEYIYQTDLDAELKYFPGATDDATKKRLLNKLVKDSIILQAGVKEKLITSPSTSSKTTDMVLPDNIYNSPQKDYMKRIEEVKKIEKAVNSKIDQISGSMVSLWFYNQLPAKIGIPKGKEEALKKITALHKRVVNKEITIKEASQLILADQSNADLDIGYANNAFIPFSNIKGESITIDPDFDKVLWQTKQGHVTPVFLAKSSDKEGNFVEAFYIFGQIDKKIDNGNTTDFTKWYDSVKKNYEITYY